jgi:hypothetical protein
MATARQPHTLVGVFHRGVDAYQAVRKLDEARIPPQHVSLVAGDAELAAEVGSHSFAVWGAFGGVLVGLALATVWVGFGGPSYQINPVGIAIGTFFVAGGLGFIGFVFGRALVVRGSRSTTYAHTVDGGGAVVAVACVADECDRAREVLGGAGVDDIVDEEYAERF